MTGWFSFSHTVEKALGQLIIYHALRFRSHLSDEI